MLVGNLTLGFTHAGEKPNTGTYSCWWETLHWNLRMSGKYYTGTYSCWWETLHRDLLMLVGNLTLGLTHAGGKPYTGTYS